MARFKTETDSTMSAFVPKPIYCLMGLMSIIGSQEMDLTSSSGIDGAMGTFSKTSKTTFYKLPAAAKVLLGLK